MVAACIIKNYLSIYCMSILIL